MIDKKFEKIYWILGDPNAIPQKLTVPVEYIIGMPEEFTNKTNKPVCWVLDDSMSDQNKGVLNLMTRGSHHQNISVIFITQNIFHQGKYSRDISLNFSHLCIMNNPRDKNQFCFLARQLFPTNSKELVRIYNEITDKPYSYLFIDLTQTTHNLFRFRTDIFNPNYSTIFCVSPLPKEINEKLVENEECVEGSAYSACFEEQQM